MDLTAYDADLADRGISDARRRDSRRVLDSFGASLGERSLFQATGGDLRAFLERRAAEGCAPSTLRKERHIVLAYFGWAKDVSHINGDTLLSLRDVKTPAAVSSRSRPCPYTSKELRRLRGVVDDRWPRLTDEAALRRVTRWSEGITPYPRIRHHAIRLQLDAVIALSLHGGLRRSEIFRLHLDDLHYDNAYIVVWRGERFGSEAREVPFTEDCRARVKGWIEFRSAMRPTHDRPWLNLWSGNTARSPLGKDAFDKLLASYLGREWTFRRLRHTAGINWLKAGMTIWELQRLLGHRMLKDTLPYGEAMEVALSSRVERLERALSDRLPIPA